MGDSRGTRRGLARDSRGTRTLFGGLALKTYGFGLGFKGTRAGPLIPFILLKGIRAIRARLWGELALQTHGAGLGSRRTHARPVTPLRIGKGILSSRILRRDGRLSSRILRGALLEFYDGSLLEFYEALF